MTSIAVVFAVASVLAVSVGGCCDKHHAKREPPPRRPGRLECPVLAPAEDAVFLPYRTLLYCRGKEKLTLEWEFMTVGDRDRLYVPKLERWEREMPAWTSKRRDELLERILTLTWRRGWNFVVVEY